MQKYLDLIHRNANIKERKNMKIIGEREGSLRKEYIVEMDADEVANILGYYWHGSNGIPDIKVGTTFDIQNMYNAIHDTIGTKIQLTEFADKLENMLDSIKKLI